MPNTRISDLTAATSVAGTDVYPSVQTAGVGPVKTSLTQITAFALANAPAGAVATPSIAPTGDTNTGFWFPAADTIAASTGGTERMRIDSSGNVGIGTSPSVWGFGGNLEFPATNNIAFKGSGNLLFNSYYSVSAGNYLYTTTAGASRYQGAAGEHRWFVASSGTAGNAISFTQAMTLNASGNVGIGTTSIPASARLALGVGNIVLTDLYSFGWGAQNTYIYGSSTTAKIFLATNNVDRMTIDNTGNVGIGTTSPSELLELTGAVRANLALRGNYAGGTNIGGIKFLNAAGANTAAIYAETTTGTASDTAFFAFYTMNSGTAGERMRITGAGNVLINTTSISTGCIAAINGKIDLKTGNTSIGKIEAAKSISVTTSATTVISGYVFGGLAIVNGNDGTNQFTDLVFWGYSGTPTVINSQTISGSPAARTYTAVAGDLKLAMASGTYTVAAVAITANNG